MEEQPNLTTFERFLAELSTLGPIGKKLPAPGTWGSLVGVVFYYFVFDKTGLCEIENFGIFLGLALLLVLVAIPICGYGEKFFGRKDPGEVNFDEFAVIPICFAGFGSVGTGLGAVCILTAGFVLFRVFDILKPWKIKSLQNLNGGLGVVADDFAAAVVTCICMLLVKLLLFTS